MAALLISVSSSHAQSIDVDPGAVNFNVGDGLCSLYEAAQSVIDGAPVDPVCNNPAVGFLTNINLAPASTYVLDTDPDLDGVYLPQTSFALNGNGSVIMRNAAAPELVFIRFPPSSEGIINNTRLANAGAGGVALDVMTPNVIVDGVGFINNGQSVSISNSSGFQLRNSTLRGTGSEIGMLINGGMGTIANSTFSGLAVGISITNAQFTLNNNTIVNNAIGIDAIGAGAGSIANTIVANNSSRDCSGDAGDQLQSAGFNISSDAANTCFLVPANNDLIDTDPLLGPLTDNGGFNQTHLPQTGSPAIDNGNNASCEANDQRGMMRPLDGNGDLVDDCDIGSVEIRLTDADLSVISQVNTKSATAGDTLIYQLIIGNSGPAGIDGQNGSVNAQFPPELINTSWTCAGTGGAFCAPGGTGNNINENPLIPAGESITYTVTTEIAAGVTGNIAVTTTAMTMGINDPVAGNDSATTTVVVGAPNLDFAISKTDGVAAALPGDILSYVITVQNLGDMTINNVMVNDTFPNGLININWTCAADPGAMCAATGTGDINEMVSMAPGSELTFTANAEIDSMFTGVISNTATVSLNPPDVDPDPANNTATDVTNVVMSSADLFVTKSVNRQSASPGDVIEYTVTAGQNLITRQAHESIRGGFGEVAATVIDFIPAQLNDVTWTCAADTNSQCPMVGFGDIEAPVSIAEDEQVVFSVSGVVRQGASGDLSNQASVVLPPDVVDIDPANNSQTVNTVINRAFDVAIEKTDDQDASTPGAEIVYQLSVDNNGMFGMFADVVDELPEVLENVSWTCLPAEGASCANESGTGDIQETIDIPAGGSVVFEVAATINAEFEGELENTASVIPQQGIMDQFPADNSSTDSTEIRAAADLDVSKTGPITAVSGMQVIFEVDVTNNGPNTALDVVLLDQWTAGLLLQDINDDGFTCAGTGATANGTFSGVQCTLDALAAGESRLLQFTFMVTAQIGEIVGNAADITSATADPDPDNNLSLAEVAVASVLRLQPDVAALPDGDTGQPYSVVITALGGIEPISLTVIGLPNGLTASSDGRILTISGVPDTAGIAQLQVSASDALNPPQFSQRTYTLQVMTVLEFAPRMLPVANTDEPYLARITPANGVAPYVVEVDGLPAGLFNNNGNLQGQPQSVGEFELQVMATDIQGNTGQQDYTLTVAAGLQLTEQDLPPAVQGVSYGQQLRSSGGQGPNSWSGGNGLPAGLSLSNTGFISGIPQAAGEFSLSAAVSDSAGARVSGQFNLAVAPAGLIQQEINFPNGVVGLPYTTPTAIAGGSQPYACMVLESSLPPGLILNGCNSGIEGTPVRGGSYRFVLAVEDNQTPPQTLLVPARIQIAERTPIALDQPPDPAFQPPIEVPVPEFGAGAPADSFADESLQAVASDAFGNRYLSGFGWNGDNYDIRVLKYDAQGALVWEQRFDSGDQDYAYAVTVSPLDQRLYVGGYSLQGGQFVATLLRYDLAGVLQQASFDSAGSVVKAYYALQADSVGVYAIGESYNGRDFDGLVVRYDLAGNRLFETVRNADDSQTAYAAALNNCDSSGVCDLVIGGFAGNTDRTGWLASVSRTGGPVQMLATLADPVFALQPFANGDWLVGSSSNADDWVVRRLSAAGAAIWATTISQGERLRSVSIDAGGFVLAAGSSQGAGGSDGLLIVLDGDGVQRDAMMFDNGQREVFSGGLIGPEGILTLVGERGATGDTRFLYLNVNTGKAF